VPATIQPSPLTGKNIRLALFGRLRRRAARCYVVSPFLEDYEFEPLDTLSHFLGKYVDDGCHVILLTCPPAGKVSEVLRKHELLEKFQRKGVNVRVNASLHAKVYLFVDDHRPMSMVGSANMTSGGMEKHIELALLSHNAALTSRLEVNIRRFLDLPGTITFRRWAMGNRAVRDNDR